MSKAKLKLAKMGSVGREEARVVTWRCIPRGARVKFEDSATRRFCALQDRDGSMYIYIYLILIYLSLSKNGVLHASFKGHPNVSNDGVQHWLVLDLFLACCGQSPTKKLPPSKSIRKPTIKIFKQYLKYLTPLKHAQCPRWPWWPPWVQWRSTTSNSPASMLAGRAGWRWQGGEKDL